FCPHSVGYIVCDFLNPFLRRIHCNYFTSEAFQVLGQAESKVSQSQHCKLFFLNYFLTHLVLLIYPIRIPLEGSCLILSFGFFLAAKANAIVRGPTRPMYIISISTILAGVPRDGVRSAERPTVQMADVVSYSTLEKDTSGSRTDTSRVPSTRIPRK